MLLDLMRAYANEITSLQLLVLFISVIVNTVFASAVAKDAGQLAKENMPTILVSGMIWAFATLVGGVFVAATYWVLHHSKLTRN